MKKTRQGVKDLNNLKGYSAGRKYEDPPEDAFICKDHEWVSIYYNEECRKCGVSRVQNR